VPPGLRLRKRTVSWPSLASLNPQALAEHVRMHAEWHLRGFPELRNHPAEAGGAHGCSPLT